MKISRSYCLLVIIVLVILFVATPASALSTAVSSTAVETGDDADADGFESVAATGEDEETLTGEDGDVSDSNGIGTDETVDDSTDEFDDESTAEPDAIDDGTDSEGSTNETTDDLTNETIIDDRELSDSMLADLEETETPIGIDETVIEGELGTDLDRLPTESDDRTDGTGSSDTAGDGSDSDEQRTEQSADDETGGESIPGGNTGAGAAIGAGVTGLALLARRLGTPVVLSAGQSTGAGGSLLSAAATAIREWAWRGLALLGYQRFSDDDPLEHDARASLYEYIESAPGSYLSEISEETDVPLQSARYHLRILEFENLVDRESIRGRRRYFPIGIETAELEAALNDEATAAVLRALAEGGPDSVTGLAETLGRDPSTVSHHLGRLEEDGLVERERDGRGVTNRLPEFVERAVDERERDAVPADQPDASRTTVPESAD